VKKKTTLYQNTQREEMEKTEEEKTKEKAWRFLYPAKKGFQREGKQETKV